MIQQIIVPDIGEGVESGRVVAVHLKPGDKVAIDDTVMELETDKAVVEIPSPIAGKVVEVLAREGEDLSVGTVIAKVETDAAAAEERSQAETPVSRDASPETEAAPPADTPQPAEEKERTAAPAPAPSMPASTSPAKPIPASPSIRRLARELGVDMLNVQGSGPGGRISEADIKAHVKSRMSAPAAGSAAAREPDLPDFTRWGEIEAVELEAVRRITAESTTTSWQTIPHVTQFDKADITHLEDFIAKNARKVAKGGGKLTITAIVAKVCARALKKFPSFNASIDVKNQRLIYKKYIHISMAVDTPRGLLMPVIQNVDNLSITDLAAAIMDLAERSRSRKIKLTELDGGTFSISNQGAIGGVAFTPIVLWPQSAILGVSRSAMEPAYIDGQLRPRKILPLSLSYDHRIIDGADAARFLRWVCESLENGFTMHLG